MPDLSVQYTLATPGDDIVFNNTGIDQFNLLGGPNEYYITDIQGLDGPPLRTPIDNAPQTHGGLVHPFLKGPRDVTIEGVLMIRSTRIQNDVREIRNQMEKNLREALDAIIGADGTLSWTVDYADDGPTAHSLTVRNNIRIEFRGIELKTFVFGLIAANPDY